MLAGFEPVLQLEPKLFDQKLTVEGQWVSVPEVDQGWEGLDAVALGQHRILELDHLDSKPVALVIWIKSK